MPSPFLNLLRKGDSLTAIKLRVMTSMGILPTEERAQRMSDLQWVMLCKALDEEESYNSWKTSRMVGTMLGISSGDGKIVPLSFFINPELAQMAFEDVGFNSTTLYCEVCADEQGFEKTGHKVQGRCMVCWKETECYSKTVGGNAGDSDVLGEEESKHLEEVMQVDIDRMLTEEDKKRIQQVSMDDLLRQEKLAGIIVGDKKEKDGT